MWTKKKKKSSLNIKQGPETRDGRGEGGGVENVFPGSFKYMQIAVQPI